MRHVRYPLLVAVVAVVSVLGGLAPGAATASPAAKGPSAAPHAHEVAGQLNALSCASRSACYAINLVDNNSRWGIVRITHKGASSHTTKLKKTLSPVDLNCPSSAGCALLTQVSPSAHYAVAPVSSHGVVGKPVTLGAPVGVQLTAIACHPTRSHCTAIGAYGQEITVITVIGSTPVEHDLTLPASLLGAEVKALACPTTAACFAAGAVSKKGKERGFVLPIHNGVPGSPVYIPSASYEGMYAIACTSATSCVALGASQFRVFVYALSSAKVTRSTKLPTYDGLGSIACQSAHLCDAVGSKNTGRSSPKGAVLPIHSGKPGTLQTTSATQDFSAGGGDGHGAVAGYHGGIEIIGFGTNNHTLVCSS
jgi:hypothetical protein